MSRIKANQLILVVEDSEDDYEVMMDAFELSDSLRNPIYHCEDGQSALNYLQQKPPFNDLEKYPPPAIILLDLNMPGIDGRQVLKTVKADETLRKIPVIVLTTSNDERDIEDCYELGANSYIKKPVDLDNFLDAIKQLREYWFEVSILPKGDL
ncbi:response regulator [Reinekea forsetii]|nr:response regulator [Reinekea forsetii]